MIGEIERVESAQVTGVIPIESRRRMIYRMLGAVRALTCFASAKGAYRTHDAAGLHYTAFRGTMIPERTTPRYRTVSIDGLDIFYRESGPAEAPVLLALHGFPASSHSYRFLVDGLRSRWRVIAPDLPGFGRSAAPATSDYPYTFDAYASTLESFVEALNIDRLSLYMHDYGGPVGFRFATAHPARIQSLIVQNANAYIEGLGPLFATLATLAATDDVAYEARIRATLTPQVTQYQYVAGAGNAERISPDGWSLDQYYLDRPGNDLIQVCLQRDYHNNFELYPRWQAYLREQRPPTLIVWGENDPIFLAPGAHAYLRDVPDAELHMLNGGHFVLEEHADEIVPIVDAFLAKHVR